jgi:hypothetical protein
MEDRQTVVDGSGEGAASRDGEARDFAEGEMVEEWKSSWEDNFGRSVACLGGVFRFGTFPPVGFLKEWEGGTVFRIAPPDR